MTDSNYQEPPLPTLRPVAAPLFEFNGDSSAFWGAFAKAQAAFEPVLKSRTVHVKSDKGSYSFDYAPLDEVLAKTLPALNANGFSLLHCIFGDEKKTLVTMLMHSSGGLTAKVAIPPNPRIQELGSSITYLRRYSVSCMLGIASEEDDDGNAADVNQREMAPKARQPAPSREKPPEPAPKQSSMARPLKDQIMQLSKDAGFNFQELKAFASRHDVDLDKADDAGGKKVLDALTALKVRQ